MIQEKIKVPITVKTAKKSCIVFPELEGEYNSDTQKWTAPDVFMIRTYCRSATSGFLGTDPDEDQDDDSK